MPATVSGDTAWRARQRRRRWRDGVLQGLLALAAVAALTGFALNFAASLEARQINSGFGFLRDPAGFDIGELPFDYNARDSTLRAFAVGMANTLRVALAGIVLASALGLIVGLMRLAPHRLVNWWGSAYVEVFRNTPLLVQLLVIYLLATEWLPDSSAALSSRGALLSNQGLWWAVPAPGAHATAVSLGAGVAVGVTAAALARRRLAGSACLVGLGSAVAAALLAWLAAGALAGWSRPVRDGFVISGGASLTPEFLALWLGLSLFTSSAIAELVRAGALAVPAAQWNAALALGLTRGQAMASVILPQALRLVIPPLASQYMNLIKNSSLAVVVGYPDLVSIGNTAINQNGQALEAIAITMAVYLSLNLVVAVVMGIVNARVTRAPP